MSITQQDRIEYGRLGVHAADPDYRQNDLDTALTDALANIMHWAASEPVTDFDAALARARGHFEAETSEDHGDLIAEALDYYADDLAERLDNGDYSEPEDRAGVRRTIGRCRAILVNAEALDAILGGRR